MSEAELSRAPEQYDQPVKRTSRDDIIGIVLLVAAVLSLLLGIIAVNTIYVWDSPQVLGSFLVAGECIIAFLINEQQFASRPLLRLKQSDSVTEPTFRAFINWSNLSLFAILLLTAYFDLCQITLNSLGNIYYASTVKSMSMSWHNFFFVAFEPSGSVAMDKPPISLWLQTISVKLFGLNSVGLALPLMLAGLFSIVLLFHLVRRTFGVKAGLLAALFLALTPISIVTNRATTMDGLLTLDLLCAAWAILKATETGSLRWLLFSSVLLGLGYNIKMMEAFLVLPVFLVLYLLAAPGSRWRRIGSLFLALFVLLAVSFSWSLIVDSVSALSRPFVGSSGNNTEIGLGLGYNGVGRPIGQILALAISGVSKSSSTANIIGEVYTISGGPLRLFTSLGDQTNWLLPLALLGLLSTIWQRSEETVKRRFSPGQQSLICWAGWFLVQGLFFTVYVLIHEYYLTIFAPCLAALAGIGTLGLWRDYQRPGWRGWLLPIALFLTALYQLMLIVPFAGYAPWLWPVVVVVLLSSSGLLIWWRLIGSPAISLPESPVRSGSGWSRVRARLTLTTLAVAFGVIAALLAPTTWDIATTQYAANGLVPVAGPPRSDPFVLLLVGVANYAQADPELVSYLEDHQNNAPYLVATSTSLAAAPFVLQSGRSVLPIGGFNGNDKIFTVAQLEQMVESGKVRYFWLSPLFLSSTQLAQLEPNLQKVMRELYATQAANPNQKLFDWVSAHCTALSPSQWGASDSGGADADSQPQLYDCATSH